MLCVNSKLIRWFAYLKLGIKKAIQINDIFSKKINFLCENCLQWFKIILALLLESHAK